MISAPVEGRVLAFGLTPPDGARSRLFSRWRLGVIGGWIQRAKLAILPFSVDTGVRRIIMPPRRLTLRQEFPAQTTVHQTRRSWLCDGAQPC